MLRRAAAGIAFAVVLGMAGQALAIPELQLYIEGASYDAATESWVYTPASETEKIRLWTIGAVSDNGTIADVKLAVAYQTSDVVGAVLASLTPSTTAGYGGFIDPSVSATPAFSQFGGDGSVPQLGDGSDLPTHGVYGPGTSWQEWKLGDFSLTDSPIADATSTAPITSSSGLPVPHETKTGQINVYEFGVTGLVAGSEVHFDLYNSVMAGNNGKVKYVKAPFSHDATTTGGGETVVPEPGTLLLLGSGLLGAAGAARRKKVGEEKS